MIIEFQGTLYNEQEAAKAMTFIASLNAFRTNKKTALFSFMGNKLTGNLEDIAIPPAVEDTSDNSSVSFANQFNFNDTGIDAILRRAETGRFTSEQLDNCVTPTVRDKNGLDIVKTTKDSRFEEDLAARFDTIQTILECAAATYDYIFVYVSSQHNDFLEKMGNLADKIVIVAPQGRVQPVSDTVKTFAKKTCFLITNFDENSKYSLRGLKKSYGAANIYTLPYNIKFSDACESGSVISFAMKNVHPDKTDINLELVEQAKQAMHFIDNKADDTEVDFSQEIEYVHSLFEKDTLDHVLKLKAYMMPTSRVDKTIVTKSGLFGLSKHSETVTSGRFGEGDPMDTDGLVVEDLDNIPDPATVDEATPTPEDLSDTTESTEPTTDEPTSDTNDTADTASFDREKIFGTDEESTDDQAEDTADDELNTENADEASETQTDADDIELVSEDTENTEESEDEINAASYDHHEEAPASTDDDVLEKPSLDDDDFDFLKADDNTEYTSDIDDLLNDTSDESKDAVNAPDETISDKPFETENTEDHYVSDSTPEEDFDDLSTEDASEAADDIDTPVNDAADDEAEPEISLVEEDTDDADENIDSVEDASDADEDNAEDKVEETAETADENTLVDETVEEIESEEIPDDTAASEEVPTNNAETPVETEEPVVEPTQEETPVEEPVTETPAASTEANTDAVEDDWFFS